MRGMITAMVASAQVGHQQQREALEAAKAENEQRWKVEAIRNAETVEHEKSEIARVSAEVAAQTVALNRSDGAGAHRHVLEAEPAERALAVRLSARRMTRQPLATSDAFLDRRTYQGRSSLPALLRAHTESAQAQHDTTRWSHSVLEFRPRLHPDLLAGAGRSLHRADLTRRAAATNAELFFSGRPRTHVVPSSDRHSPYGSA